MKKMRYFQSYFSKNDTEIDELDISVHCDVYVFEWLIRYLHDPSLPKIELHNVISVLISSFSPHAAPSSRMYSVKLNIKILSSILEVLVQRI